MVHYIWKNITDNIYIHQSYWISSMFHPMVPCDFHPISWKCWKCYGGRDESEQKNIILMDLKTSIIDLRRYWY